MKFSHLIGVVLLLTIGLVVMQMKNKVNDKDLLISKLHQQYVEDQKAIRVLEAEWSYLNSPDYVQDVTLRYLTLRPTQADQIMASIEDIPFRKDVDSPIIAVADFIVPSPRLKPHWASISDRGGYPDIFGAINDVTSGVVATTVVDEAIDPSNRP